MKNYFILFLSVFFAKIAISQADSCRHTNGDYTYYANLNIDTVYDSFSKQDFISHIIDSSSLSPADSAFLYETINIVDKSFPTASTDFLQHSVTVYSNSDTLENYLNSFNNSFNLIEFICHNYQLTSVKDDYNKIKILIYPIPISSNSIMKFTNIKTNTQFRFIDLNGRSIIEFNMNNDIDLNLREFNLNKGIYFVQLRTKDSFQTIRIVK